MLTPTEDPLFYKTQYHTHQKAGFITEQKIHDYLNSGTPNEDLLKDIENEWGENNHPKEEHEKNIQSHPPAIFEDENWENFNFMLNMKNE